MADRKRTPDILTDILGGGPSPAPAPRPEASIPASQEAGLPVRQDTSKPARQDTGKPASQPTRKPARQQARTPASQQASKTAEEPAPGGDRLKATYYLSSEAMAGLDEAWLQLRRMAKAEDRTRISKSLMVEQAILLALEELEAEGAESRLARRLIK